ncbi:MULTISPECIES: outer membrane protein [unclassified Sphingomonas]|uniref:outer membrane protein n=1 Tax=unclassified Sphingomonas TaxID=196159 RepID=UPI0006FAB82E|nr:MULTISPECIES: outer membrane beta-barrel protein [unclassified Sphingomonas]KQM63988.1 hypothetical protein ASE65_16225 [Sphingomonas sp. Leaf16]KQN13418.1 hypothetical protein ASE81_03110 [Sphingomonas sp. Leaf29]KQN21283.1 hypothetical protein ASE83_16205 [Sphingomonas sp. Leaf32]
MKTVATIIAATLAVVVAMPAAAQSIVETPLGPRIELRAGWDRVDAVTEVHDGSARTEASTGDSGVTYGGEVGYDMVLSGASVVGLYAGLSKSTFETCDDLFSGSTVIARDCLSAGREVAVGARIGFVTAPNSLVYLKAGYSNGEFRRDQRDLATPANNIREFTRLDGFHVGAGGEFGLTSRAYGKVEYLYTNYAADRGTVGQYRIETGVERHHVVAGLGYRF